MGSSTTNTYTHPFECAECAQQPDSAFDRFEPVDDWHIVYPEKNLVHLHYGAATWNEQMNTQEAEWIVARSRDVFSRYPEKKLFVLVDFTRSDDSEYPSDSAMDEYTALLRDSHIDRLVCYGISSAMRAILQILAHLSSERKKIKIVKNKKEADALFAEWWYQQSGLKNS